MTNTSTHTPSAYELELQAEKKRKADELRDFAKAIGGMVDTDRDDGEPRQVLRQFGGLDGIEVYFHPCWRGKPRWNIGLHKPPNVTLYNDPVPSITASKDRTPEALLRDVKARLMPAAVAWLGRANAKRTAELEYDAKIQANIDALIAAAKAAGLDPREATHQKRCEGGDGTVWVAGESVRVCSDRFVIERPDWPSADATLAAIRLMGKGS